MMFVLYGNGHTVAAPMDKVGRKQGETCPAQNLYHYITLAPDYYH